MGDRTNLVLILAGEMLRKAEYLLTMGLHPSEVVLGYELARDKAIEELESASSSFLLIPETLLTLPLPAELTVRTLETPLTAETLTLALKPTLAAKQYGSEDLLSRLVSEAVMAVMPKDIRAVRFSALPFARFLTSRLTRSKRAVQRRQRTSGQDHGRRT